MKTQWTRVVAPVLVAILLSACASAQKQAFYYPEPAQSAPALGRVSVILGPTTDARSGDKAIDQAYESDPVEEISKALKTELVASGIAGQVDLAESAEASQPNAYRVSAELLAMDWEIPDYESKRKKAFWVSMLTGGLGGVIYGNSKTDVYGCVSLRVRVVEPNNNIALEKIYRGESADRMTLFSAETRATGCG